MGDLLSMLKNSIDFCFGLTYIEFFEISVFEVALVGFLAYSLFRFIISPLIGVGGGSWGLFTSVSDSVKTSKANETKQNISNRIGFR